MPLASESVLQNGKYTLGAVQQSGNLLVAYQSLLGNQPVLVKTLADPEPSKPSSERDRQRFLDLGRRLIQLPHRHLEPVVDCFEEQDRAFWVTLFVPGASIVERVKQAPLEESEALQGIRSVAGAVATLHQGGLRHGGVQPQRLVQRWGTPNLILVDPGLGALLGPSAVTSGWIDPAYAAPEVQRAQATLTAATDIYSLAATLFALLTGKKPPIADQLRFDGLSLPLLRRLCPTLSRPVEQAIAWGLQSEPAQRPQKVDQWLQALKDPGAIALPALPASPARPKAAAVNLPRVSRVTPPLPSSPPEVPPPSAQPAPVAAHSASPAAPPVPAPSPKPSVGPSPPVTSTSSPQGDRALPRALLLTALLAAVGGASLGWLWRSGAIAEGILSRPSFLRQEQTFPRRDQWPISESAEDGDLPPPAELPAETWSEEPYEAPIEPPSSYEEWQPAEPEPYNPPAYDPPAYEAEPAPADPAPAPDPEPVDPEPAPVYEPPVQEAPPPAPPAPEPIPEPLPMPEPELPPLPPPEPPASSQMEAPPPPMS